MFLSFSSINGTLTGFKHIGWNSKNNYIILANAKKYHQSISRWETRWERLVGNKLDRRWKQPRQEVGSESERVTKNGQEGADRCEKVTGRFAVGEVARIGTSWCSSIFARSPADREKCKRRTRECAAIFKRTKMRWWGASWHNWYHNLLARKRDCVKERKREREEERGRETRATCYERADAMQASDSHLASWDSEWKKGRSLRVPWCAFSQREAAVT